ncbi:hypothetical protein BST44_02075 [Mycobacterium scrofulaceum]|uniref:Uncharacterized protein n=1 Tax=Mycobacterium scrofulaceum TaxID=1783 RepID=A0A1X0KKV5_MYCSC|nr:hypothetical protein BST44_02075 [Mycobacterium scrofulaceum]
MASAAKPGAADRRQKTPRRSQARRSRARRIDARKPRGDRKRGEAGRGGSTPENPAAIASAAKPGAAGRRQ